MEKMLRLNPAHRGIIDSC